MAPGVLTDGAMLLDLLQTKITSDFPTWAPNDGRCRQRTDLYAAHPLSRAEVAPFLGIR